MRKIADRNGKKISVKTTKKSAKMQKYAGCVNKLFLLEAIHCPLSLKRNWNKAQKRVYQIGWENKKRGHFHITGKNRKEQHLQNVVYLLENRFWFFFLQILFHNWGIHDAHLLLTDLYEQRKKNNNFDFTAEIDGKWKVCFLYFCFFKNSRFNRFHEGDFGYISEIFEGWKCFNKRKSIWREVAFC